MTESPRAVSRTAVVDAPPAAVFDLLARPARHVEIDGSGSVQGSLEGPDRLGPGDTFGMKMKIGLPYRIKNTVVEFEEGRRIAWRHLGRHVWRYELEATLLDDGRPGTRVTETFDWSTALVPKAVEVMRYPASNATSIEQTLVRLQAVFADGSRSPAGS
ncbi:MAG: Polyketide cyclase / dehydrase and lipid transport [Frankiales bacterium]|nr:Polyketide cyclase / dehydrase and lipid transport [Frankiales bacterium]